MAKVLFWKHAHRFVAWLPPGVSGTYIAILGFFAAAAQSGNAQARRLLNEQMQIIEDTVNMPYLIFYVAGGVTIWLAAYFWSSYKIELAATIAAPPRDEFDNAIAAVRASQRFFPLKTKLGE